MKMIKSLLDFGVFSFCTVLLLYRGKKGLSFKRGGKKNRAESIYLRQKKACRCGKRRRRRRKRRDGQRSFIKITRGGGRIRRPKKVICGNDDVHRRKKSPILKQPRKDPFPSVYEEKELIFSLEIVESFSAQR